MTLAAFKPTLPSQFPRVNNPFDAQTALTDLAGNTLTSSGYSQVSSAQAIVDLGYGVAEYQWALSISAIDVASTDEVYKLALIGSNDVAFGNGNCELLAYHEYAAAASARVVANKLAPVAATGVVVPDPGSAGSWDTFPFYNYRNGMNFRYVSLYAVLSGTTPSITFISWIGPDSN